MTVSMRIAAAGAVTPGGPGYAALERAESWPVVRQPAVEGDAVDYAAMRCAERDPELERWRVEPRLRRSSAITLHLTAAMDQCLAGVPREERGRVGVAGVFFVGCLSYSIRFYREAMRQGRRFASPILFPETVFNSPMSHAAATLGIGGPVYSQIGDTSAWVAALRTAAVWLATGAAERVVVVAAEEFDALAVEGVRTARLLGGAGGLTLAEGAGAVLLDGEPGGVRVTGLSPGYRYRTRGEARDAAVRCLGALPDGPRMRTARARWLRGVERGLPQGVEGPAGPRCEAWSVSAAWDTVCAAEWVRRSGRAITVPVWGYSSQISALQVGPG
jgi:hypothetical protein